MTDTTHPHVGHCPTCRCQRDDVDHITVYPSNERIGNCRTCGQVRWFTERYHGDGSGLSDDQRSMHCGCCTHPHDLANGGHTVPCRCPAAAVGS